MGPICSERASHVSQQQGAHHLLDRVDAGSRAASGGSGLRGVDSAADRHAAAHRGCRNAGRHIAAAAANCYAATAGRSYRHPECYPYLDRYPTTASGAATPTLEPRQPRQWRPSNTRSGAYVHAARCADSAYTDPIGYAHSHFNTDADADTHTSPSGCAARSELVDPRTAVVPIPSYIAYLSPSLESLILESDFVVRASLASVSTKTVSLEQDFFWIDDSAMLPGQIHAPLCAATLELHFEIVEYLKGTGPTDVTVEVPMRHSYLDEDRLLRYLHLEEEALLNAAEWWSRRSSWDDGLAVLFLKRDEYDEVDLTFTERSWGYDHYYLAPGV